MAITWRATHARVIPRSSGTASTRCSIDLPQPRLPRVLRHCNGGVLDSATSTPEHPAAGRELLLLWVRSPLVPGADCDLHGDRLLRRERDGGLAGAEEAVPVDQHLLEFRHARVLQILQLFCRERARGAAGGGPERLAAGSPRPAAGWHLVLYVPGDELHDRRVSRRAARAPKSARCRRVHFLLSPPRRRTDPACLVSPAPGREAPFFLDRGGSHRTAEDLLGVFQETGHRRQRRRDCQQGVRARRSVVSA